MELRSADGGASVILSTVGEGRRVRLLTVCGGHGLAARLAAMGLAPGAEVVVVQNSGRGPLLLAVRHARIAVGRGMAHKIRVSTNSEP